MNVAQAARSVSSVLRAVSIGEGVAMNLINELEYALTSSFDWIQYQFFITFIQENRYKMFLYGFSNTIIIAVSAVIIGTVIGSLVAVVRVYHSQTGKARLLNRLSGLYLAVFRGTPVVVQLLIMYYIVFISSQNPLIVAMVTFGINSGAYVAEIVRAGILAVDIGQMEAGRSLGLSHSRTMRLIILPQAIKNILPALGNEFVVLLKETSVAGYITVMDLARAGDYIRTRTLEPYFSLLFIALVYFILVFGVSQLFKLMERRLRRGDRG